MMSDMIWGRAARTLGIVRGCNKGSPARNVRIVPALPVIPAQAGIYHAASTLGRRGSRLEAGMTSDMPQAQNRRPGLCRDGGLRSPVKDQAVGCATPETAATSAAKSDASFSMPSPSWKRT